ncbi:DMT family transporter [Ascidiimonas sp. W6]|uniref:DMT family transporter n=1 Tax=Ascidiimonas meishanensis TaxID=3128903 RepID=UPI0030EDB64A
MQNDDLKNYLHLHLIVFLWGFTAILGALISIEALPLVWYRMLMASILIGFYILIRKISIKVPWRTLILFILGGILIALHWVTFFGAIKTSNVSITLAMMSTGSFFTAILEPIWYKRRVIWYEIIFGLIVIVGLYIIFKVEGEYVYGIVLALISAFLSALFSLLNGKLVKEQKPSVISLYELFSGTLFLSVFLLFKGSFTAQFFTISISDWSYLFILASVSTAYAFIASVKIMKFISPYTVMLTINMEPVYGILLAFFILGDSERMDSGFYIGAVVILATVIANGILKYRLKKKSASF